MRLTQITPFILCSSLERQVAFYCDVLGFEVVYLDPGSYSFLKRDEVAIRLLQVDSSIDLSHPERQNSFYIDVQGINALWLDLQPLLDDLPEGRVRAPFDQPYGQREFHVADEDCTSVFFGEAIPRH